MPQISVLSWARAWVQSVFPISKQEGKQVVLLCLLKFLITYVFCVLEALRQTSLVMSKHAAVEVIYVVKVFVSFPISILALALYTRLSNYFRQSTLFYSIVLFFLSVIFLYGFVFCPHEDMVIPNALADRLTVYFNGKHIHWIAVLRYWIHVLFFIISELWGQLVLAVMYWSFVNSIYNISQAKKFYAVFITAGQVGTLLAGASVLNYTEKYRNQDFLFTVQNLLAHVIKAGILILMVYWLVNRQLKKSKPVIVKANSEKLCLSFWESIKYIILSPYLRNIAMMVIACNLSINFIDGTWKSYIRSSCEHVADYQILTSEVVFWTGIGSLLSAFLVSGRVIRNFGWEITAKVAPITMGIMGCVFFFMSYARHNIPGIYNFFGDKLIWYIVFLGGVHSVISKVVKYNFYDKTTQIAYIPLDVEAKIKGKAAVDMLGSRFGKAVSSWIQLILLEVFNTHSIQTCSGVLFWILFIVTVVWYQAIHQVGKQLRVFESEENKNSIYE